MVVRFMLVCCLQVVLLLEFFILKMNHTLVCKHMPFQSRATSSLWNRYCCSKDDYVLFGWGKTTTNSVMTICKIGITNQTWWHEPVVPDTWEAKAGESVDLWIWGCSVLWLHLWIALALQPEQQSKTLSKVDSATWKVWDLAVFSRLRLFHWNHKITKVSREGSR